MNDLCEILSTHASHITEKLVFPNDRAMEMFSELVVLRKSASCPNNPSFLSLVDEQEKPRTITVTLCT